MFVTGVMLVGSALHGEDFYEAQLRLAKDAARAGRTAEAAESFRIASFGFLERPALLLESLAQLALAQSRGDATDLAHTLDRFLEVETRFAAYGSAVLDKSDRTAFEALLSASVPSARLSAVPSLAHLATTPEKSDRRKHRAEAQPEPAPSPAASDVQTSRSAPVSSSVAAPPADVLAGARAAAARGNHKVAIRLASDAIEASPENRDAFAVRAHSRVWTRDYRGALEDFDHVTDDALDQDPTLIRDLFVALVQTRDFDRAQSIQKKLQPVANERGDVRQAAETLSRARPAQPAASTPAASSDAPAATGRSAAITAPANPRDPVLRESSRLVHEGRPGEAAKILYDALQDDPTRRDLRLAFLEAATLFGDWRTASSQLSLLTPFRGGEESYVFYAAVVAYETGRIADAKRYLAASIGRIPRRSYVDYYKDKIESAR